MNLIDYINLYNAFSKGYRHAHLDKQFISQCNKIIKNIMKKDGISREDAGIKLILMCKENNYSEVSKYYV